MLKMGEKSNILDYLDCHDLDFSRMLDCMVLTTVYPNTACSGH